MVGTSNQSVPEMAIDLRESSRFIMIQIAIVRIPMAWDG